MARTKKDPKPELTAKTKSTKTQAPVAKLTESVPASAANALKPEPKPKSKPVTPAPATATTTQANEPADPLDADALRQSDRFWQDKGWTAVVIKNEDDDGWAVSMTMDGEAEPSLIGPWTMGRDKKNPKPLDANAFTTLVKNANEIIMRHQQQTHAALHKSTKVATKSGRVRVTLDIVPDEDNPHAVLSAFDDTGVELAQFRVAANFKFDHAVASTWVANDFAKPKGASEH